MRGQQAEYLVDDYQGTQALSAGQGAHPAEHFVQQQAEYQAALFVFQVGDTEDDAWGAAASRREPRAHVETHARAPACKARGDEQRVQCRRQRSPLSAGDERVDGQRTDFHERWLEEIVDQCGDVRWLPG